MPEVKTYVPKCSAKARTTQYGEILNLSFHAETLKAFMAQHANEKGYLNLTVSKRKDVGQYGDTHSVFLNDWKPQQQDGAQTSAPAAAAAPSEESDGVPGLR